MLSKPTTLMLAESKSHLWNPRNHHLQAKIWLAWNLAFRTFWNLWRLKWIEMQHSGKWNLHQIPWPELGLEPWSQGFRTIRQDLRPLWRHLQKQLLDWNSNLVTAQPPELVLVRYFIFIRIGTSLQNSQPVDEWLSPQAKNLFQAQTNL